MTRTSVVIVGFRSAGHLERGLPALLDDPCVGHVVVVDNSRDQATASLIGRTEGRVRYVDPGANLGFAKACNLGARLTGDPVITFLNPDVLLTRSLARLAEACSADPHAIMAGGLTSTAGSSIANARRAVSVTGEVRRAVLGSRTSLVSVPMDGQTRTVDQVDGALLVMARAFFEHLGGFDERFELYFEDVDLCDRARQAGRVLLDTRRYGVHVAGASARTASAAAYFAFRVSRVRYLAKRAGARGSVAAVLVTLVEAAARTLTRQPDGPTVRSAALRLALREAVRPGCVSVLPQGIGA